MASILTLIKGSTEVNLWDSSGFEALQDGFTFDVAEGEPNIVRERVKCKLTATSKDNAASQIVTLNRLLRDAYLYNMGDPTQTVPVYMKTQLDGETNPRYALVAGEYVKFRKTPYNQHIADGNIFPDIEVVLIREHPWRSHKPGILPGRINLLATDGPDFMTSRGDHSVDLTSTFGHVPSVMTGGIIGGDGYPFGDAAREFTRNMLPNPSFEESVSGQWFNNNFDAVSRSTSDYLFGQYCYHCEENNSGGAGNEYLYSDFITNIYPGATYVASAYFKAEYDDQADYAEIGIWWYTSGDVFISLDAIPFDPGDITGWTRYVVSAVPPDTAAKAQVVIRGISIGVGDVWDLWIDGTQFERGRYATDFCDGTQENCAWEGDPHNSMSIRMGTAQERRGVQVAAATKNELKNTQFLKWTGTIPTNWNTFITGTATGSRAAYPDDAYAGLYSCYLAKEDHGCDNYGIVSDYLDTGGVSTNWAYQIRLKILSYVTTAEIHIQLKLFDAADSDVGDFSTTILLTDDYLDTWTLVANCSNAMDATAKKFLLYIWTETEACEYLVDAAQVEKKAYPTPYCDGSLGSGHSWSGAEHASTSSRTVSVLKYDLPSGEGLSDKGTLGFWFEPIYEADEHTGFDRVFSLSDGTANNRFHFFVHAGGNDYRGEWIYDGGAGYWDSLVAADITRGNRYLILFTWDVENDEAKFYFNGTWKQDLVGTCGAMARGWDRLYIGAAYNGASNGAGWVDDFFILKDKVWTAAEVTDYYNSGKPFAGDPSLYMYLPFDGPQRTHVANFHEELGHEIDVIFNEDNSGGPAYSSNYAFSENWQMWDAAAIAQNDAVLFGSTHGPFHHIVLNMIGAGLVSGTFELSYWTGAAFTVLTLGDDYTILGAEDLEAALEAEGEIVINLFPSDTAYDWDSVAINGVTAYWVRLRNTHAGAACTTYPVVGGYPVYAPRTNHIRIPATALHGDAHPTTLLRLAAPYGGDDDEGPANISRILWGIKSRNLDGFCSFLNAAGYDVPSGWAFSAGTDASAVADGRASGGYHVAVSYATDETLTARAILTGSSRLPYFVGDYKIFVLAQQVGGTDEACSIMVRTYIGTTDSESPHVDTDTVALKDTDLGWELADLGTLNIPFSTIAANESFAATDLIFEIHTNRDTGDAATLEIHALVLIPVDEASGAMDDAKTDITGGSMALRGNEAVDHDAGVIIRRTNKVVLGASGNDYRSVMDWDSGGAFIEFNRLDQEARVYFILLHYPTGGTWGTGPLIATMGCHVAAELQLHHRYNLLRGND